MKRRFIFTGLVLGLLLSVTAWLGRVEAGEEFTPRQLTPAQVQNALRKGRDVLLRKLLQNEYQGMDSRALIVLALLNAGTPRSHPVVAATIEDLVNRRNDLTKENYHGIYQAGLLLSMFAMLNEERYQASVSELERKLRRYQNENGGWGDYSRTQFALLGLKAAEDLGCTIPETCYQHAREYLEKGQNEDGGWPYRPLFQVRDEVPQTERLRIRAAQSYGSMTAACVSGLFICGARLYRGNKVCGEPHADRSLALGLDWLGRNFSMRGNPNRGFSYLHYYMYAIERIGVLLAQRTIGGHDWYREGADNLVRAQNEDGTWTGDWPATEFAMLFLGKGSQPIAVQKLNYGPDWNRVPYDAKLWVETAAKDLKRPMAFQTLDASKATVEDLSGAPILYFNGYKAFTLTPEFRIALKTFIDQGGFVYVSACCGSEAFITSFKSEMKSLYPDTPFQKLDANHPVYHAAHRIVDPKAQCLEGMDIGCRVSVILIPHAACCAWGGCGGCADDDRIMPDSAMPLGVNLIAYALGFSRLKDKLEELRVGPNLSSDKPPRAALEIGQLSHEGGWNPGPAALSNLGETLRRQSGVRNEVFPRRVVLGQDDPTTCPVLYLTGYKDFTFSDAQIKVLREYLDRGGFLFADPWCGKDEFDTAFRKLCVALYPDTPLTRLPLDSSVFKAPFAIEHVEYKERVAEKYPELGSQPHLEGISLNGRFAVLYSRFNLGCELQGAPNPRSLGVKGEDAYRLAVNMLLYGLGH